LNTVKNSVRGGEVVGKGGGARSINTKALVGIGGQGILGYESGYRRAHEEPVFVPSGNGTGG